MPKTSKATVQQGAVPYDTVTVTLAAGEIRNIPGDLDSLALESATDTTKVEVSFNGGSFWPILPGRRMKDLDASEFWIRNTLGTANTIVLFRGGYASVEDNNMRIAGTVAVAEADGSNVAMGAKADAAATTDAGTFSLIALVKRLLGKLAAIAPGAAVGTAAPVLVGGTDGTNVRMIVTDTGGRTINVGAAGNGTAVAGAPVLVGGSDGTNARTLGIDASGRPTVLVSGTVPVSVADGSDSAMGAKADAAATTDAGTFSLIALVKRLLGKFVTVTTGAAFGTTAVPMAGTDGTNARGLLTDAGGRLVINGSANALQITGQASVGFAASSYPISCAGVDGSGNVRHLRTDNNGYALVGSADPTNGLFVRGTADQVGSTALGLYAQRCAGVTIADGLVRDLALDQSGAMLTPHCLQTPVTATISTTTPTVVSTAAASYYLHVGYLHLNNRGGATNDVQVTLGGVLIWRGTLAAGAYLSVPIGGQLRSTTTAASLSVTCGTAGTIDVSAGVRSIK